MVLEERDPDSPDLLEGRFHVGSLGSVGDSYQPKSSNDICGVSPELAVLEGSMTDHSTSSVPPPPQSMGWLPKEIALTVGALETMLLRGATGASVNAPSAILQFVLTT